MLSIDNYNVYMCKKSLFICLFFLKFSTHAFAEKSKDICEPPQFQKAVVEEFEKAQDPTYCESTVKKFASCSSGATDAYLAEQKEQCYQSIMNKELDKRLLTLKNTDKATFDREMKIQAAFNKARTLFCVSSEEVGFGTGWKIEESDCRAKLYLFRYEQASERNLEIKTIPKKLCRTTIAMFPVISRSIDLGIGTNGRIA